MFSIWRFRTSPDTGIVTTTSLQLKVVWLNFTGLVPIKDKVCVPESSGITRVSSFRIALCAAIALVSTASSKTSAIAAHNAVRELDTRVIPELSGTQTLSLTGTNPVKLSQTTFSCRLLVPISSDALYRQMLNTKIISLTPDFTYDNQLDANGDVLLGSFYPVQQPKSLAPLKSVVDFSGNYNSEIIGYSPNTGDLHRLKGYVNVDRYSMYGRTLTALGTSIFFVDVLCP